MENGYGENNDLHELFIDLTVAFKSVDRKIYFKTLNIYSEFDVTWI